MRHSLNHKSNQLHSLRTGIAKYLRIDTTSIIGDKKQFMSFPFHSIHTYTLATRRLGRCAVLNLKKMLYDHDVTENNFTRAARWQSRHLVA